MASLHTGLIVAISLSLLAAMVSDMRQRIIPDWVPASILAVAPAIWFATGLNPWPDMALRLLGAGITFGLFAAIFAAGRMGGGDVKLISALSLCFAPIDVIWFLLTMSLIGGALSLLVLIKAQLSRRPVPDVPYGVAIGLSAMGLLLHPLI